MHQLLVSSFSCYISSKGQLETCSAVRHNLWIRIFYNWQKSTGHTATSTEIMLRSLPPVPTSFYKKQLQCMAFSYVVSPGVYLATFLLRASSQKVSNYTVISVMTGFLYVVGRKTMSNVRIDCTQGRKHSYLQFFTWISYYVSLLVVLNMPTDLTELSHCGWLSPSSGECDCMCMTPSLDRYFFRLLSMSNDVWQYNKDKHASPQRPFLRTVRQTAKTRFAVVSSPKNCWTNYQDRLLWP